MVLLTEQIIRGKTRLDRLDEVKNREWHMRDSFLAWNFTPIPGMGLQMSVQGHLERS